jgi:hypothetical protein
MHYKALASSLLLSAVAVSAKTGALGDAKVNTDNPSNQK